MDRIPNELLFDIAQLLPKFDLTLSFAKVSRRWFLIALTVVRRPDNQTLLEGQRSLKKFLNTGAGITSDPYPYIQCASLNVICALSFNTLIFSKITESAGTFQRSDTIWNVTYDTNLARTPQPQRILLWTYAQFSILSFPVEGAPHPRIVYKRALAGRKNILFSRSGRYLACSARTFAQTHTELHDTSRPTSTPLKAWSAGVQCIDFSPDEQSYVYVDSCGQILIQRLHEATAAPRIVANNCCGTFRCILSIKYSRSGEQVVAVAADGHIRIYDLKSRPVQQIGFDVPGMCYSAEMHLSPTDDFIAIAAEHGDSSNGSHELRVICLRTGAVVFRLSQQRATTSTYEFVCFLEHLSGIVMLVNGKLNCWIFPVEVTKQQRPIQLTSTFEDEIHHGRVVSMGSQDLLVGGADGKVNVIEMPGLERVLFGSKSSCKTWQSCR